MSPGIEDIQRRMNRLWAAWWMVAGLIVVASLWAAGQVGENLAITELQSQARTGADINTALLRTVLEKQRTLPFMLSRDREVGSALASPDAANADRLNRKLEGIVAETRAAVVYVIRPDGLTIAASNWREETSFVGNTYSFRDYFRFGMQHGSAEQFALGNVSKRPGLYISRRVEGADGPLGLVVVKVEFDQLETDWQQSGNPSYVIDQRGIVIITSLPDWRFMTMARIPSEGMAAIRESLQFGDAPLQPVAFTTGMDVGGNSDLVRVELPGAKSSTQFLRLRVDVPASQWRLDHLVPTDPAISASVRTSRLTVVMGLAPLLALGTYLLYRRQKTLLQIAREQLAREKLESRVLERTRDLSQARDRLQDEINGHRATEQKLRTVQMELVQANRLAILGQVAAGVAHEINQPVATIRAYADNARTFIDRGSPAPAMENLGMICALTERIGTITDDLRALSRKGRATAEPVDIKDIVEGAILLLRSRFGDQLSLLHVAPPPDGLRVMGHRIRLEQVMINLLQNALEAVAARADGRVDVGFDETGETLSLTVCDNGPGLPPDIRKSLFTPFNTSKDGGLGLGLVITKDIVMDYGGDIAVSEDGGLTCFCVTLKKA